MIVENIRKISAILFINIALTAALFARIRVYQKLMSKYEHNPTPSHPINMVTKLSLMTKKIIKQVKSDK